MEIFEAHCVFICAPYMYVRTSLLLKVCQTLKNRSRDVRDAGRDTLVKMACALGPKYLRYITKEMKDMLTRGYMVLTHVGAVCLIM